MKENREERKARIVLSEDVKTRNNQVIAFVKDFCEDHKSLMDKLGE